jgi:hypothetical protein
LRVLHLASFSGNIGDNANHSGFRNYFETIVGESVTWFNEEIREYYWREKVFDETFVAKVNTFDLLVIGGGNYFELWPNDSPTGTSITLPIPFWRKITKPILINGVGVDLGQGASSTPSADSIISWKLFSMIRKILFPLETMARCRH